MIHQIITEQLLLEKKIAELKDNLVISYDLRHDTSGHGEQRKWRHVSQGDGRIYDYDIIKIIELAKNDITFSIVTDQIQDQVRFIVSQKSSPHLNVIIKPELINPYQWNLIIITVMNKKDFEIGRGQLQFFV